MHLPTFNVANFLISFFLIFYRKHFIVTGLAAVFIEAKNMPATEASLGLWFNRLAIHFNCTPISATDCARPVAADVASCRHCLYLLILFTF